MHSLTYHVQKLCYLSHPLPLDPAVFRQLRSSVGCSRRYHTACPESEYHNIEVVLSQYSSVYDLCNYDNIYEGSYRGVGQCHWPQY